MTRPKGEFFEQIAWYGYSPEHINYMKKHPIAAGRSTISGRTVLEGKVVHVPDTQADPEFAFPFPPSVMKHITPARAMLGVPLKRDGIPIGVFALARSTPRPFTDRQIELVTTFADQAVIAIENARLFDEVQARTKELTELLEQQTATSEVLQVISSSPGELEQVFEAVLANATRLCGAKFGVLSLLMSGDVFQNASLYNMPPGIAEARLREPFHPHPKSGMAYLARTKEMFQIEDLRTQPPYLEGDPAVVAMVDVAGARTILAVPMLKESTLVGAITIFRQEVHPFTDQQIELVRNFAKQAVIAIENARLLNELRESLQQQTATADVLKVISSSPGELEPVFSEMLENATRICEAQFGTLFNYDGRLFHPAAVRNAPPALLEFYQQRGSFQPPPGTSLDRLLKTRDVVNRVDDFVGEVPSSAARLGGAKSQLAVPMFKDEALVGAIVIYRQEVRPFTDKQIALVQNFAAQAVIAIENTRLLNELRDRTTQLGRSVEELRALGDVSQAVNSTLDLKTVLDTIVAKAVQLSGTEAGTIYEFDEHQRDLLFRSTYGMDDSVIAALKDHHIGISEPTIDQAVRSRAPVQISDVREIPMTPARDITSRAGYRALLVVPLLARDHVVGVLVVRRKAPGAFPQDTVDLLKTFAAQSVLAIQNAHLFTEIDEKSRQVEIASQHKSQFLANMSHELRTPLNAILGYTELILDNIYGETPDKMREVLDRLQANGKHLLGLINDVLDLSKIEAGQLTLDLSDYSLKDIVHTVFTAVESLATGKNLALTISGASAGVRLPCGGAAG